MDGDHGVSLQPGVGFCTHADSSVKRRLRLQLLGQCKLSRTSACVSGLRQRHSQAVVDCRCPGNQSGRPSERGYRFLVLSLLEIVAPDLVVRGRHVRLHLQHFLQLKIDSS